MAKSSNQKSKLLYLAKIFSTETDEEHGLTLPEIVSHLDQYNISADRKTLYQDFEELRHFGMDIVSIKSGRNTTYHLVSREFELPELKLLVDSVQASKFITEKKSRSLIGKLEGLVSKYESQQLHRQVLITGRIKTMNESIYYSVDKLHNAISKNRQIQFKYFQWNVDKKETWRHDGEWYVVSPWHLKWDDENYYLIGYDDTSHQIKHYRVDKMKQISLTDSPREGQKAMKDFNPALYTNRLFGMYGGQEEHVAIEATNELVGIFIDRFGKDIPIIKKDAHHFTAYVDAAVSLQFLGWIIGLGPDVKITGPKSVVNQMEELTKRLKDQYLSEN